MSKEEQFFSRQHLVQAGWGVVLAVVVGIGGYLVGVARSKVTGGEKVIIATPDDGAAPLVVRMDPLDDPQRRYVESLEGIAAELRQLREVEAQRQANPPSSAQPKSTDSLRFNRPTIPSFEMPSVVQGYTRASLAGFAQASCPPSEVVAGDTLAIQMRTEPSISTAVLTPAFVRVDRPNPDGGLFHVFGQQFDIRPGINTFPMPINLNPGPHHVEVGFYLRSELEREFPNFHSIRCPIVVTGRQP